MADVEFQLSFYWLDFSYHEGYWEKNSRGINLLWTMKMTMNYELWTMDYELL